ncbi:alpha/beta hydrolase [Mycobacterium sp. CBMA271]|uniref:alpha/beta fold hydrolase n=1 Tax=unclassified Mycobacteroides TaxID=2618759 RepID=UPI0012DFBFAC|nr:MULTISPECIES: alpha/beta hydrolase [unclassified Mycobacteroides]MUM15548.1 hydrolase [Mycobacteroides sp. CBMA 326]MUM17343.1 hydrolase [Mycobacteroides sp. CBMA 326]MUM21815.1 alpha/beta hydrolase [Mycobacteroides sp. CBMA 271]
MPHVELNGQSIFYTDTGEHDLPVVLGTHATLMDTVSLEELTKRISEAGFRVVTFDLRGHGQTVYDKNPYMIEDMVGDAVGLMDHLGVQSFTFLGEGQGAVLALRTALAAPARIKGLVLLGSTAAAPDASENAALEAAMDIWCTNGPDPAVYGLVAQFATGTQKDADALLERWQRSDWKHYREASNALANRTDFVAQLGSIVAPALVLHGTEDFFVPIQLGKTVAENLGGETVFETIDGERQTISVAFNPRVAEHVTAWLTKTNA